MNADILCYIISYLNHCDDIISFARTNKYLYELTQQNIGRICNVLKVPSVDNFISFKKAMYIAPHMRLKMMCIDGFIRKGFVMNKNTKIIGSLYRAAKYGHIDCLEYILNKFSFGELYNVICRAAIRSRRYNLFNKYCHQANMDDKYIKALLVLYPSRNYDRFITTPNNMNKKDAIVCIKGKSCNDTGLFYYYAKNNIEYSEDLKLSFRCAKYALKFNYKFDQFHFTSRIYYLFKAGRFYETRELNINRNEKMHIGDDDYCGSAIESYIDHLTYRYGWARSYIMKGSMSIQSRSPSLYSKSNDFSTSVSDPCYRSKSPSEDIPIYIPLNRQPVTKPRPVVIRRKKTIIVPKINHLVYGK